MIYLYTGGNGAGKTQFALRHAFDLKGKTDRPIYAHGIKGLDHVKANVLPLDHPENWQALPDGSIVLIDEAQDTIPQRDYKKPVPAWINELAKHRHRGFDFILTTPHGSQIDHFVRRLVVHHAHVKRKTMGRSLVVTWDRYEEKPDDFLRQMSAQKAIKRLDKQMWALYQSATLHTHKKRLPWQVALVAVLVPLVLFLIVKGVYGFTDNTDALQAPEAETGAEAPPPGAGVAPGTFVPGEPVRMTAMEWAAQFEPRIPGIPASAPAYDGREVVDYPIPLCIEVVGKHCRCYTQQVTRLDVPQDICLRIVHEGLWDPYRKPFHFTAGSNGSTSRGGP